MISICKSMYLAKAPVGAMHCPTKIQQQTMKSPDPWCLVSTRLSTNSNLNHPKSGKLVAQRLDIYILMGSR